jgi:tRNA pseudouridine55 synthase
LIAGQIDCSLALIVNLRKYMTRRHSGRQVNGILLLNKPLGISSNAALQRAKRLFQARKAGHTGSLDNLATGLLPICFGEATKFSSFLLDADKYYRAECTLGVTTTTGDAEGEILQTRPVDSLDLKKINQVIQKFTGTISQIPPMYSALKYQGKSLYKLARQGKVVERQPRQITIYSLTLHDWQVNRLTIEVHCSKGTYIRTLAEDIGETLGYGAYLSALHRFGVDEYRQMYSFEQLEQEAQQGLEVLDQRLLPMYAALSHWPQVQLTDELAYYIRQGHAIQVPHSPTTGWVKLFTEYQFLGIGEVLDDGRIAPRRLINL